MGTPLIWTLSTAPQVPSVLTWFDCTMYGVDTGTQTQAYWWEAMGHLPVDDISCKGSFESNFRDKVGWNFRLFHECKCSTRHVGKEK